MFDGILFDLDGTLWNATSEIVKSWNIGLIKCGVTRPPLTREELLPCMGLLLPDIGARLFPELPEQRRAEVMDCCCQVECDYLSKFGATLYPGTAETLETLSKQFPLLLVSNCQDGYIQAFFQGTGMGRFFTDFECAGRTGLPKSQNIRLAADRNALHHPVYIGDTALDAVSAHEAGVAFLHAAYGFGDAPGERALTDIRDLPDLLTRLGPP